MRWSISGFFVPNVYFSRLQCVYRGRSLFLCGLALPPLTPPFTGAPSFNPRPLIGHRVSSILGAPSNSSVRFGQLIADRHFPLIITAHFLRKDFVWFGRNKGGKIRCFKMLKQGISRATRWDYRLRTTPAAVVCAAQCICDHTKKKRRNIN